jgi:tetratricopeptide (TPR) repeat protein/TolB-like protein
VHPPNAAAATTTLNSAALSSASVVIAPTSTASEAPSPHSRTIAVLPFSDQTGWARLDFTRSGLPHLLGQELARDSGIRVVGHYELRQRVSPNSPEEAWVAAARDARVDVLVRGEVSARGRDAHVVVTAEELTSKRIITRVERDVSLDALSSEIRAIAVDVGSAVLGRPIEFRPSAGRALEVERELQLGIEALERESYDWTLANQHLSAALEHDPSLGQANYYLAIVSWWRADPTAETLKFIERGLAAKVSDSEAAFLTGLRLFLQPKFRAAVQHYRSAVERWPDDRYLQYGLFEAYFHAGDAAESVRIYRQICNRWPHFHLGFLHPSDYYYARGDGEGLTWLEHTLSTVRADDVGTAASIRMARRDPLGAIEIAQAGLETPHLAEVRGKHLRGVLVQGYALTGRANVALALERQDPAPLARLGLLNAVGEANRATARKEAFDTCEHELGRGRPRDCLQLVLLEAPSPDLAWLEKIRDLFAHAPSSSQFLSSELPRVFLAGWLGDAKLMSAAKQSEYSEVVAITEGFAAEGRRDWPTAARAWARAVDQSSDGIARLTERFFQARALREVGDHSGVIAACEEVIEPFYLMWSWGSIVGPCHAWTAQANAALGRPEAARAACDHLSELRALAAPGDELLAMCAGITGAKGKP